MMAKFHFQVHQLHHFAQQAVHPKDGQKFQPAYPPFAHQSRPGHYLRAYYYLSGNFFRPG